MSTVAPQTPTRKPRAYYAHLYDEAGMLGQVDGVIFFMNSATGELVEVEPTMCNFLTVLGNVGLADTQQIMDQIHGGYAAVCTSRQMEVA